MQEALRNLIIVFYVYLTKKIATKNLDYRIYYNYTSYFLIVPYPMTD